MKYVIGVDESGTGAWAGPFTVCAYASPTSSSTAIFEAGARDSKTLTDARRRGLCVDLLALDSVRANIQVVGIDKIHIKGQREAWREAIALAVKQVIEALGQNHHYDLRIDGSEDSTLTGYFARVWNLRAGFFVKGDQKIPEISAASILAKTERNDHLLDAHKAHPQYGFDEHYGYGTEAHMEAIAVYGVCAVHRRIRPLYSYFNL